MGHRRRPLRRRPALGGDSRVPIACRVGHRRSKIKYEEVALHGPADAASFSRVVHDQVRLHPHDPLIIAVNGYQPWLGQVLHTCIEDHWSDIADLDRAVQYAHTMQFPEKASQRGRWVPWTFIIDQMNVPHVYYWSVNLEPPMMHDNDLPNMADFRLRTGVWFCAKGACKLDRNISVTIVFTKPSPVSERIVTKLLFEYLWRDNDFDQPREDEEGICWTFSRLYYLCSDWQNIIGEVLARLDEAEINSHGRHLPVKARTRRMHREVDRIYEMKEYLHFHTRSFKKLQRLQIEVPPEQRKDPLWNDMDDAVEDLDQFESTLDGLKERFNNLIELEFNITNATQSDNSAFLSGVATLFIPLSLVASIFGFTTITWPVIWFVYIAVPIFVVSVIFTAVFPALRKYIQKLAEPVQRPMALQPDQFTMLAEEYPDVVTVPRDRQGRSRHQTPLRQHSLARKPSRTQIRAWSRLGDSEEKDYY